MERAIRKGVIVDAPVSEVWRAWTTEDGAVTFFAPQAHVELAIGGRYEMLFSLSAPPGSQGGGRPPHTQLSARGDAVV